MTGKPWTVARVLATPKAEIVAAVKRGEGPPADVMAEIIRGGLARQLRRVR
jgi:hypothetical protein